MLSLLIVAFAIAWFFGVCWLLDRCKRRQCRQEEINVRKN